MPQPDSIKVALYGGYFDGMATFVERGAPFVHLKAPSTGAEDHDVYSYRRRLPYLDKYDWVGLNK